MTTAAKCQDKTRREKGSISGTRCRHSAGINSLIPAEDLHPNTQTIAGFIVQDQHPELHSETNWMPAQSIDLLLPAWNGYESTELSFVRAKSSRLSSGTASPINSTFQ